MDLLEDTDLRREHGSEAVHGFESYIYSKNKDFDYLYLIFFP
jgi:hypothetical protein